MMQNLMDKKTSKMIQFLLLRSGQEMSQYEVFCNMLFRKSYDLPVKIIDCVVIIAAIIAVFTQQYELNRYKIM